MSPKFKLPELFDRARQMRREDMPAAWKLLRDRRTLGFKFRRQVPIGHYIVDFYCPEIRLIIEIDGGVHDRPEQAERDEQRNCRLRDLGYMVLHCPNNPVLNNPACFTEMIRALRATLFLREESPTVCLLPPRPAPTG